MHFLFLILGCFTVSLFGKSPGVTVKDIPVSEDTSIVIKKGAATKDCIEYELVDGQDEIVGDPDYDKTKARLSWKSACADWKKTFRELNKDNQVLAMNCNSPEMAKEETQFTFKSIGSYKIKTKKRETQ